MRAQRKRFVLLLTLIVLLVTGSAKAQTLYRVKIEQGVSVKMRDGVTLAADIFRPISDEKFPVLLERTPYDRNGETAMANELASHGYLVVLQDTRGRYGSGGEFYPFRDESFDGYDTVEWAARLDHSNGKVGMFGGSYVGATQMLAAMAVPPHLIAIFPYVTASEYYDGWTYQSGALMQWFASSWTSILATDTLRRQAEKAQAPREWTSQLPLEAYPILKTPELSTLAPYFKDWLAHESDDAYWRKWKVSDHYSEMTVLGLHGAGWHDLFLKGSIKNYVGLHEHAATPDARAGQRLIIGPWAHAPTSPEGKIGDVVFGKTAVLDMTATALKWFDYSLKGTRNEYATAAPVRLFIMGDNVWRDEQEFPLKRTRFTKYYLHSEKGANSLNGDGSLSLTPPAIERKDEFDYDPKKPVPTIGGRLCCGQALPPGPADQRPNEARADVLVFSTPPLTEDTEVTGFISLELYASTSAVDTDFTALLVDVDPNGYARFLTDGIVRSRHEGSPVVPGKVVKYTIDLWATGNVFKSGHRIRLYVSSSNFPRFNLNLNPAHQTIYHDRQYSSALILPVIPKVTGP
ncbi:MAG TPA: CocE/NonD family hydrolase [Pyrinomonadaceae bacterium]|jgi:putative CocE/NonD family hydrolase|nr:CocE/NonD family hydrolase [Pyrinomonadaceae bacterium]